MTWTQFMEIGAEIETAVIDKITEEAQVGTCATLIYTSGTTGTPKAAMVSHDNLTWTAKLAYELLDQTDASITLSYLPLSHIAAQMLDIHGPIASAGSVYFARPDALKGTLGLSLKKVRPTLFLGVPRVWEKIMEKMLAMGQQTTGFKKTIAQWAKKKGLEGNYNRQNGSGEPWGWFFANMLVFDKVKAALGLDRCTIRATGAAPITVETLEYFMSLDLPIMEVYGMSETSGLITVSRPHQYRTKSCGVCLPGTEVRLAEPDADGNGEIITRGRQIFMGYMFNEEKTAAAFDDEGFLHTGDVGKFDADGFLYITGRIKDLIITAGGENVAPVHVENLLKAAMPYLSNAFCIGDRRKFLSALLTFKVEVDAETGVPSNQLTAPARAALAAEGIQAATVEEAMADPRLDEVVNAGLARANEKAISNAQMVRKYVILPEDFSVPGGTLTSTLKCKRNVVLSKYAEIIEDIYA
ncbi:long-chain-fatty-acid-CoA ligase ACSBG2 [Thecamonas trahens ATCC 50062]|uniref:Long-chain-fatty-acid-CoA ligase ACSBG2 n=1 Tax=Thecamonas trahens ATCC 50062 TaxID=461836 RepID=A0A0L0DGX4_THETB|nr:long-chain-fatty-acid-CoA ligase ACSBG2 [Thecamonas trahens ATCC 50062]KNC51589.1 long-chain-fatty-acid-CoA ligase ACSBG2 [Thecamonas trahens ATCC 50062]|eukprot:XP_013755988.1 long-chain-fatty-acid-CoA ligase ACSBG2 [Thecamonas trahens ATCC 50062]